MRSSLLCITALAVLGCTVASQPSPTVPESDLTILAKYRQWTLVNPTPQLMEPKVSTDCDFIRARQQQNPHLDKYISVFVNSVGRDEMMTKRNPKFPVGSMIVKEKLGSPASTKPEMLTAMIKREAGYDPEEGDWEYLVLDGAASKIVEQGKLTRCSGCHRTYKFSDFVTRTYLPETVRNELKP